jgi:all-trans-retinol 13,14-reductase
MIYGSHYEKTQRSETYDAIVIGSGIGGLSTAILLGHTGKRVLVLERHYTAGGFTHTFTRKGYEWDVGIHYIGEVHRKGRFLRTCFDFLSRDELDWHPIEDPYDTAIFGNRRFAFHSGEEVFVENLIREFPEERDAVAQYMKLLKALRRAAFSFFANKSMPPILSKITAPWMAGRFRKIAARTTAEVLDELTDNKELKAILTTQFGDYGLTPGSSSFAIHAMVASHYMNGGAYPVGGSGQIARTLVRHIESLQGLVCTGMGVKLILTQGKRVRGVEMENGDIIKCPLVISDAGYHNTMFRLLDQPTPLRDIEPSIGHLCLYVGLKGSPQDLKLPQGNMWIFPGFDHDENFDTFMSNPEAPFPALYISFSSAKDPSWPERFPGHATLEIISAAPYSWFEAWASQPHRKRGREYMELKERFSLRMLEALFEQLPHLRDAVDYTEMSTPLSTKHYCGYEHGEIYGLDHTPQRFMSKDLGPRTSIKGLFLTGQDVITDGIAGALFAGIVTSSAILKRNMISYIQKNT